MDVDSSTSPTPSQDLPEVEMYLRLLLIHHLLSTPTTASRQSALSLAKETVVKIQSLNRRTMDPIGAKIWWAYGRAYEVVDGVQLSALRPSVMSSYSLFLANLLIPVSSLRHNELLLSDEMMTLTRF